MEGVRGNGSRQEEITIKVRHVHMVYQDVGVSQQCGKHAQQH